MFQQFIRLKNQYIHLKLENIRFKPKGASTTKRMARRGLRNAEKGNPQVYDSLAPFYKAVLGGKLPQYYLDTLKEYKARSDDLPPELLSVTDPRYGKMKCLDNAIVGLSLTLQGTIEEGLVNDPSIMAAIEKFTKHNWNAFKGVGKAMTTPEEIKLINDTLDIVIGYLKTKYKLE